MEIECEQRLTKVEESTKSAHHRIDSIEGGQKEIRDLALAINTLASEVKSICEDMADINGRVKCIEAKPGEKWEKASWLVITIIITAIVGYAVGKSF